MPCRVLIGGTSEVKNGLLILIPARVRPHEKGSAFIHVVSSGKSRLNDEEREMKCRCLDRAISLHADLSLTSRRLVDDAYRFESESEHKCIEHVHSLYFHSPVSYAGKSSCIDSRSRPAMVVVWRSHLSPNGFRASFTCSHRTLLSIMSLPDKIGLGGAASQCRSAVFGAA